MCGIAGIFSYKGKADIGIKDLKMMLNAIAHRGPDDEGIFLYSCITGKSIQAKSGEDAAGGRFTAGIGHRRLSIIDLSSAAHQPMKNEKGNIWMSYNGEIYNFKSLRKELEENGHRFRSCSDSEVIIHLYEEEGDDFIKKLDGVFAFALWDSRKNRLLLARDRLGVKTIYYTDIKGQLVFSSEIKGILASERTAAELDYRTMAEYFTFQNTLGEDTIFKGIKILSPASLLVVDGGGIRTKEYWKIKFDNHRDRGEKYYIEHLRQILEKTVKSQLISDVPVGSYLSGGIDSASIVAVASRCIDRFATFTCGFDLSNVEGLEASFDERLQAEKIASKFKTSHYEMVLHSGDMPWILPRLVKYEEELRVGMSYQNHYTAKLASRFVKVILGGSGGDELFGGYPWRYQPVLKASTIREFDNFYFGFWQRLVPENAHREFFSKETFSKMGDYSPFESYKKIFEKSFLDSNGDFLNRALYFDLKTFLHGLLTIEDKINMSYSLEIRVPLLGRDVVDFALKIPSKYKVDGGLGKAVFRKAVKGLLPDELIMQRKQGFSPPEGSWYRGETMDYVKEILLTGRAKKRGFFNYRYIEKIIGEHLSGNANHRLLIWSLLCFEWWNRIFLEGEKVVNDG